MCRRHRHLHALNMKLTITVSVFAAPTSQRDAWKARTGKAATVPDLMKYFQDRVTDIVKPLNKSMMMWQVLCCRCARITVCMRALLGQMFARFTHARLHRTRMTNSATRTWTSRSVSSHGCAGVALVMGHCCAPRPTVAVLFKLCAGTSTTTAHGSTTTAMILFPSGVLCTMSSFRSFGVVKVRMGVFRRVELVFVLWWNVVGMCHVDPYRCSCACVRACVRV